MQTSDILQVQFRSVSVVQPPRGLPHGLESRCTDSGREAHKQTIPSTIFHDPWSKGIPKEVKLRIRVMSFTTSVLAIDDMRLVWMHFEAARRKTIRKRHLDGISLHFGFAMYQSIVNITAPRNTRVPPCHPDIERVMRVQKSERVRAARRLLAAGTSMAEAAVTLSRNFGLSRRQAYRYLEEAQLDGPPSAPAEASITITLKMPASLVRDLRVHAMHSGMTTSEIVRRAIFAFLSATHEHG